MTVVQLGLPAETVLEFVGRNGITLTHEVAGRFGMTQRRAFDALNDLYRQQKIDRRRVNFHRTSIGYEWFLKPNAKVDNNKE